MVRKTVRITSHDVGILLLAAVFFLGIASAQSNTCGPVCPEPLELKPDVVIAAGSCGCNPELPVDESSTPSCNCPSVEPGGYEITCADQNSESLSTTDLTQCEEVNRPRLTRLCCRDPSYNLCPSAGDAGAGVVLEMQSPERQLFHGDSHYTTCESISDMFSLLSYNRTWAETSSAFYSDELEMLKLDLDWTGLCGCTGSQLPSMCPSACRGGGEIIEDADFNFVLAPDDYVLLPDCLSAPVFTCSQAIAIIDGISNQSSCDAWLGPIDAQCCTGGSTYTFPEFPQCASTPENDEMAMDDVSSSITISPSIESTGDPSGSDDGNVIGTDEPSAASGGTFGGMAGLSMMLFVYLVLQDAQ
mmetsp:Transcript_33018/g.80248  ORF Transcript_33018/g.80248 Transcript_33018/m.80248 type:complete len:359 (-) Transcript_33018:237-1313(-)|eukprot:CAMPEP_0113459000 /NCGR_PEP_ID=MMETSP0014_2-20120614/10215_1 /TAXON_ID=2857 /ORGANISM="Nitzschia sp." /LENGTH=358 /DNA_ID=CAMNT_0000350547 /DNA_START=248 /DNA_END=1324 /DNA_ORIENTATION=+ /assembly_acc=CAM_ASM_000159